MSKGKIKSSRGQGLIESLAIILFVTVGVVGLITFQHYLAYSNSISQQQSDATIIATSTIETLLDFDVLTVTAGYTAYPSIASGTSTTTVGNTTYTVTSTVTAFTNPTYKTLDVVVTWTDRQGGAQSLQLDSRVAGVDPAGSAAFM